MGHGESPLFRRNVVDTWGSVSPTAPTSGCVALQRIAGGFDIDKALGRNTVNSRFYGFIPEFAGEKPIVLKLLAVL